MRALRLCAVPAVRAAELRAAGRLAAPAPEPAPAESQREAAPAEGDANRCVGATVAVDVGARRLWLSDTIRFEGNRSAILADSTALVENVARALAAHPGICVRLEGHTNSNCGLGCDGEAECENKRCALNFGGRGGAVGASLARAEAVRASLVADDGIDEDRVSAIGLAGSRRLVEDTNGPGCHRNRRVEVHTLAF